MRSHGFRTLPNAHAPFALRAALRELQLHVDEGLTTEEFELTRTFLRKYSPHFAETTAARLGYAVDLSDAEAGRDSRGRSHHRSLAVEARRRAHDDYPRRRSVRTLATQRMQSPDHSLT
jgi:hypothetical protein